MAIELWTKMARISLLSRTPTTYASPMEAPSCQPFEGRTLSTRRFAFAASAKFAFGGAVDASAEPLLTTQDDAVPE